MEFNSLPIDVENLQNEASKAIQFITNYYKNVEKYPVLSQVEPNYLGELIPKNAPSKPESLELILEDIDSKIVHGLTHWQSPNFFAYFPNNASNAGLLGEILCSGLNVVGFDWSTSPAATELEGIVIDWMGKLLNLPQPFLFSGGGGGVIYGGHFSGTTCEAVLCTLAAARDRALRTHGEESITKLVVYASDQTHLCFRKGAKLIGILPKNFRVISTSAITDYSLCPNDLRKAIAVDIALGLVPFFVGASIGTTSTNAVDPILGLGNVASQVGAWLHVDAAYAGSAFICPEFQHYFNGMDLVDSFSMNPHKWLLTNNDCCCMWLKNPKSLTDSLSTSADYLKNKVNTPLEHVVDYKDWQVSLSRRFRALKLWIVLRRYGSIELMSHIRSDIELAKHFESLIKEDKRFEVVVPRKFALVCFRLKPVSQDYHDKDANVMNQRLLESINLSGKAYLSYGVVEGTFFIRCAIGATLTKKDNIDCLWVLIQEKASELRKVEEHSLDPDMDGKQCYTRSCI